MSTCPKWCRRRSEYSGGIFRNGHQQKSLLNCTAKERKGVARNESWVSGCTGRGWQCFYLCEIRLHWRRPCSVGSNVHRDSGGIESCWAPWHVHRGFIHGLEGQVTTPPWESQGGWNVWGERANEDRPFLVWPRSFQPRTCFKPKLRHAHKGTLRKYSARSARAQHVIQDLQSRLKVLPERTSLSASPALGSQPGRLLLIQAVNKKRATSSPH